MTAQVCKKCEYYLTNGMCLRKNKKVGAWNDWCEEKRTDWDNWRLQQ